MAVFQKAFLIFVGTVAVAAVSRKIDKWMTPSTEGKITGLGDHFELNRGLSPVDPMKIFNKFYNREPKTWQETIELKDFLKNKTLTHDAISDNCQLKGKTASEVLNRFNQLNKQSIDASRIVPSFLLKFVPYCVRQSETRKKFEEYRQSVAITDNAKLNQEYRDLNTNIRRCADSPERNKLLAYISKKTDPESLLVPDLMRGKYSSNITLQDCFKTAKRLYRNQQQIPGTPKIITKDGTRKSTWSRHEPTAAASIIARHPTQGRTPPPKSRVSTVLYMLGYRGRSDLQPAPS